MKKKKKREGFYTSPTEAQIEPSPNSVDDLLRRRFQS